jgi:putative aldouronate transport system substrate-binding protein
MGTDSTGLSRRSFLSTTAVGAGAAAVAGPLLAACSSGTSSTGGVSSKTGLAAALPDYVPSSSAPTPELPSVQGLNGAATDPGYLSYPTNLVKTVTSTPGSGGSYSAITPLWGSIPAANNSYYQAINNALGASVAISPSNGNLYAQTVPTLVAGNRLPDWLQIPNWWSQNLNVGELAVTKFADLTDYLSGSNVRKYPNLAAIPSGGWEAASWNDLFYRKDILDSKGINVADVKTADDLYALGKELTATSANVWAFDVLWLMIQQIFNVPGTTNDVMVKGGKVVSAFDSPEMEEALAFAYKLAKSGYVHPQGLANDTSDANNRFYGGKVLITAGGTGAWNAADAVQGQAANPKYRRGAFPLFSHDGSTPTIALGNSATIISYLNKSLSKNQIEECLALANYLAAPYGSYEYTLINFGVEGTDWTMGATGPTYTTQGTKESNQDTYQFLAGPRSVTTNPGYNSVTQDFRTWAVDAAQHAYKPAFYNMNVNTPSRFSSVTTATELNDVINEVTFGTKTVSDFKTAAANWKSGGGNQLIDWWQKNVYDKYGDNAS